MPRTSLPASLLLAVPVLLAAVPARAAPELITNGNFETWTVNDAASGQSYIVKGGQTSGSGGATLTGWENTGYTFVFKPGTASSTGAVVNAASNTNLALWGPDGGASSRNYSNNGLAGSPTGGSFLASDGAYQQGLVMQKVDNLVVGQAYNLSFYWAAAQQAGFTGANTLGWTVYWGESASSYASFSTAMVSNASKGFVAWRKETTQFVATSASMTLAFLATSGPNGSPPFSLLDGVSLQAAAVPEPASWGMMLAGLGACTAFALRRRRGGLVAAEGFEPPTKGL